MTMISQTRDEDSIYLQWLSTENFSSQILAIHLKLSLSIHQFFFVSVCLFLNFFINAEPVHNSKGTNNNLKMHITKCRAILGNFTPKKMNFVSLKGANATLNDKTSNLLAVEIAHIILCHSVLGLLCIFNA